jgi:hypothetical protein
MAEFAWGFSSVADSVQVVLRPEQTKGFVLLKKRWLGGGTHFWMADGLSAICLKLLRLLSTLP